VEFKTEKPQVTSNKQVLWVEIENNQRSTTSQKRTNAAQVEKKTDKSQILGGISCHFSTRKQS